MDFKKVFINFKKIFMYILSFCASIFCCLFSFAFFISSFYLAGICFLILGILSMPFSDVRSFLNRTFLRNKKIKTIMVCCLFVLGVFSFVAKDVPEDVVQPTETPVATIVSDEIVTKTKKESCLNENPQNTPYKNDVSNIEVVETLMPTIKPEVTPTVVEPTKAPSKSNVVTTSNPVFTSIPTSIPVPTPTPTIVSTEVPTITPTAVPTAIPTPVPTPVIKEETVWISATGSKYHSNPNCSNMQSPREVPLSEAQAMGKTPCKNCY